MKRKIHEYQMVIDANHRQSLSSKEKEILELKRQAEEDRRLQNERVTQLEQMQHKLKLQSMIGSQFAQARPPPVVETASTTMHARAEVAPPAFGDRDYNIQSSTRCEAIYANPRNFELDSNQSTNFWAISRNEIVD